MFARQVMAGHVPHELAMRFPDGRFGFELHDCSDASHSEAQALAAAKSRAADAAKQGGGTGACIGTLDDVMDGAAALLAPQSADQLLGRLPQSVVRDGNLVPVRAELAEMLGRQAPTAAVPSRRAEAQAAHAGAADGADLRALRAARLRRFEAQ